MGRKAAERAISFRNLQSRAALEESTELLKHLVRVKQFHYTYLKTWLSIF